jgi:hypothetical protein
MVADVMNDLANLFASHDINCKVSCTFTSNDSYNYKPLVCFSGKVNTVLKSYNIEIYDDISKTAELHDQITNIASDDGKYIVSIVTNEVACKLDILLSPA